MIFYKNERRGTGKDKNINDKDYVRNIVIHGLLYQGNRYFIVNLWTLFSISVSQFRLKSLVYCTNIYLIEFNKCLTSDDPPTTVIQFPNSL